MLKYQLRETLDDRRSFMLPSNIKLRKEVKPLMYITLDNLIQIGIFLTGFTVMLLGLLSFTKKK